MQEEWVAYLRHTDEHAGNDTLKRASCGRVALASKPFANSDVITFPLGLVALHSVDLDWSVAEVLGHGAAFAGNSQDSALDSARLD